MTVGSVAGVKPSGRADSDHLREAADRHYIWQSIPRAEVEPLILATGQGVTVTDVDGNCFIDLTSSGSRASTLGYRQPEVI
jgi:4-aminobutyrate aminotransferase-like enzyme